MPARPKPDRAINDFMTADAKLRILLAEDNPVNRKLVTLMLERQGHTVTSVDDGRQAIESWGKGAFDMILMDVMMPKLNGLDATRQIREAESARGGHIPIIAITANAMFGDREECLAAGMDGYVSKPIDAQLLWHEIGLARQASVAPRPSEAVARDKGDVLLDHAEALERMGGSEELLQSLFRVFLDEYDNYIGNIRQAHASDNQGDLIRHSHTLKGALGTLSAKRARAWAERLEHAARAGERPRYEELIVELQRELELLKAEMLK